MREILLLMVPKELAITLEEEVKEPGNSVGEKAVGSLVFYRGM